MCLTQKHIPGGKYFKVNINFIQNMEKFNQIIGV